MTTVTATKARGSLYALIDEANASHEPIQITGKRGNAVLISEDDWRSIRETLLPPVHTRHGRVHPESQGRRCRESFGGSRLVSYTIVYSRQAQKDAARLKKSNLKGKAIELIEILKVDPLRTPPRLGILTGNLQGCYFQEDQYPA